MKTDYPGIDYGLGNSNINPKTGIRYGVISQNSLDPEVLWDAVDEKYVPRCPACGEEMGEDPNWVQLSDGEGEQCPGCGELVRDGDQWGDEPDERVIDGEYKGFVSQGGDVWLIESPYYTNAQFCSPCAPGAGHLDNPCDDGPRTYCWGHEWFETRAPYVVRKVDGGDVVLPD
jgi:hypothetical protein